MFFRTLLNSMLKSFSVQFALFYYHYMWPWHFARNTALAHGNLVQEESSESKASFLSCTDTRIAQNSAINCNPTKVTIKYIKTSCNAHRLLCGAMLRGAYSHKLRVTTK